MQTRYDAVVIGTGFGGSVAACRLAQAGQNICIFERGRRYDINPFPRNWDDPADGWLWQVSQGLFDLKHFSQMMVVEAAGLGGGSLIYANVHLRAPEEVFKEGWPANYSRTALNPYYDLVAYMLDINPITTSRHLGLPTKSRLMFDMAAAMQRSAQFCYPNIAVDFAEPNLEHKNKFGVNQRGCNYCGECDIGCNNHSKNTLDLNYLALARENGADTETQCEVTRIEPDPAGGYKVTFKDHRIGGQIGTVSAGRAFVCAGAVNSTELLLRCRDQYGTLPNISDRLGMNYSGNGDFLAFAFNIKDPFIPTTGPTITTGIVYSREDGGADNWFIFEEGGYPKEIGKLLQVLNPKHGILSGLGSLSRVELEALLHRAGSSAGADPQTDHSAIFLAMGRDRADGRLSLHPLTYGLDIHWNLPSNMPLYDAEERFVKELAQKMGGDPALNPFWRLSRLPVSVHNLGGCPIADSSAQGVADANGEVFGYPGLFVMDGASIPVAIGANPSHTIAAVAERNIESAIRAIRNDPNWRAPGWPAPPIVDPLLNVTIPPDGVPPLNP